MKKHQWLGWRSDQSFQTHGWIVLICQMTSCTSRPASRVQGIHGTSRGSWQHPRIGYWVILNDAELKLFQQHHVFQVARTTDSSHGINCVRNGSSSENLTTTYTIISGIMIDNYLHYWEADSMSSINSLNLRQHAQGRLPLASLMDEIMIFRVQVPLLGVARSPSCITCAVLRVTNEFRQVCLREPHSHCQSHVSSTQ